MIAIIFLQPQKQLLKPVEFWQKFFDFNQGRN